MKIIRHLLLGILLASLASCSEPVVDPVPKQKIGDFTAKLRGYQIPQGVVVSNIYEPFWIQHVATGFNYIHAKEKPSEIGTLDDMTGCQFIKPADNEILASIYTERGYQKTQIYQFSKEFLEKTVSRVVDAYQSKGKEAAALAVGVRPSMQVVDVFVTETEKPVYLTLITDSAIIWNIQKSEDAKISRVALIGKRPIGIANLDETVPVQVMASEKLERCKVYPAREPQPHWGLYKNAERNGEGERALKRWQATHLEFSKWFHDNFGARTDTNTAEEHRVNHFLVGDIPKQLMSRITYKTLDGVKVRLSKTDYEMIADHHGYNKRFARIVASAAKERAGIDINTPAPQELASK